MKETQEWSEIITPGIVRAVYALENLYKIAPLGGIMHIVVSDFNLENDDVDSCRESFDKREANGGILEYFSNDPEQIAIERECLEAFEGIDMLDRAIVLKIFEVFF